MSVDSGDATLPASGADETLAAGAESVTGVRSVTVRAGKADDYDELRPIDPQHFVVGQEIARGGMGRIMAARDRRLGRPVAIKELLNNTAELRARFEREARITAKLQHPAIVNILEAGEWPGGEPFYVMKLVIGESFEKVIARSASLEQRLALLPTVIAVVDAIAYAHSKQVIHRDLKPQNVLVGEFGETVVIDWGLAKDVAEGSESLAPQRVAATDDEAATIVGSVLGTPAYMPVEQARGDSVDTRADVYSLGAILYHVLVGAAPFSGKTTDETLRRVLHGGPAAIESLTPGVPRDLITIVDKAMARDAAERYPTAAELAADLKKFQTGQLVGAHEYSTWQLVVRWARAHRAAISVAAVALVVLGGLGAVGLRRIFAEQRESARLGEIAEQRRGEAEDLLAFMLGDLRAKLQPLGKLDVLKDIAVKASTYFDGQTGALSDAGLAKRAKAQRQLGEVLFDQGDTDGAERAFRESLRIAQGLVASDPQNAAWSFELAASYRRVGSILVARGDGPAALAAYRECRRLTATIVAKDPANKEWARSLAICETSIGRVLTSQGDTVGALTGFRDALATYTKLAASDPGDPSRLSDLAQLHVKVGETLLRQGDATGALLEFRTALATGETLVAKDASNTAWQADLAVGHQKVGEVLLEQGDGDGALAKFRAALAIYERLADLDPSSAFKLADASGASAQIGEVLLARGDAAGATAAFRRTLAVSQTLADRDPTNNDRKWALAFSYEKLGDGQRALADRNGALASYESSLALALEIVAADPTHIDKQRAVIAAREKLGDLYLAMGNAPRALAEYRASSEVTAAIAQQDPTNVDKQRAVAVQHTKLADAHIAMGDLDAGVAGYRSASAALQALAELDPTSASRQSDLAYAQQKLGDVLTKQGNLTAAVVALRENLMTVIRLSERDPENVQWLESLGNAQESLGDALRAQRDRPGATAAYKAAHAAMRRVLAKEPNRPGVAANASMLAQKAAGR